MMKVAFYKHKRGGLAGLFDWLIRTVTRGPYSHCELILREGIAFSASIQDGGTRFKSIEFGPDRWDFVEIEVNKYGQKWIEDFCLRETGGGYDFPGVFRFLLPWVRQSKQRWFCSEVVCAALQTRGFISADVKAWQVHPTRLYRLLTNLSQPRHFNCRCLAAGMGHP